MSETPDATLTVNSLNRPPLAYWLIPMGVALIGWLPHLWQRIVPPPEGTSYLGYVHLPMDFLAYEAFIRQAAESGSLFMANPFTVEPQSSRFILLFHWLLGQVSVVTSLTPHTLLEVARIGLVFAFFAVWWWFLVPILKNARDRLFAALLLGFAGGFDQWIRGFFPAFLDKGDSFQRIAVDTQVTYGWNFLGSSYNPLWLAGLILSLIVLRYALADNPFGTWKERAIAGATIFLLHWVHPYSSVGTLAIVGLRPIIAWIATRQLDRRALTNIVFTLALPLAAIAAVSLWQMNDPVYRASSRGFFGSRDLSLFWYPLTLGALGLAALSGWRAWRSEGHPYLISVSAWIVAVVLLHSSPLINGYHFVFLLPLPLCILGAAPVQRVFHASGIRAVLLGIALFGSSAFVLFGSLQSSELTRVATDTLKVVDLVNKLPPGNVLSHYQVGNLVAARTSHHVWVGHWFLTPDYKRREAEYAAFTERPDRFPALLEELRRSQIRYLIVPTRSAPPLAAFLETHLDSIIEQGKWTLLRLQTTEVNPAARRSP